MPRKVRRLTRYLSAAAADGRRAPLVLADGSPCNLLLLDEAKDLEDAQVGPCG
jgi:hypothetical protein